MKFRTRNILIIAVLLSGVLFAFAACAQIVPTNLWNPNYGSSTITPRPSTLQVPCANIVGGCGSGGGSSTSSPSNFTIQGSQTSTITSDGSNSQIAQLNTILNVPANFATAGCNGNPALTDFGGCVEALYQSQSSTGVHYIGIQLPNILVTQAEWKTPINFNIANLSPSLFAPSGAELHYGGTGTAITWNADNSYGHIKTEDWGFTLYGSSTPIYGGLPNSATTTGMMCGGGTGCVGIDFHDISVNGFGTDQALGANTYLDQWDNDSFSGWDGGNGYAVYIPTASNSGESLQFNNDSETDGGNSTATQAFYVANGGVADLKIYGGSMDDAQFYLGVANPLLMEGVHFENADYSQYGSYAYIYATSSSASAVTLLGNTFDQDSSSSGTTPPEYVEEAVGQLTAIGNYFDNYGSTHPTNAIDHSIGPSIPSELLCGNFNQNTAFTNWMNNFPGTIANYVCWQEQGNGYPAAMSTNGTNVVDFYSGSTIEGTYNNNGTWQFNGSVTASTSLTINGTSSFAGAETNNGISNTGNVTSTSFTATSTAISSYFPNFDTVYYFPTAAQLASGANCGAATGVTDSVTCLSDFYSAAPTSTASSSELIVPANIYSSPNTININTNGKFMAIECVPGGTVFQYTGTSTAATLNAGNSSSLNQFHPSSYGMWGCTLKGPSANGTTTGLVFGGSNGAEGGVFAYGKIWDFGTDVSYASSSWKTVLQSDDIEQAVTLWNFPSGLVNTGEHIEVYDSNFHDNTATSSAYNYGNCVTAEGGGYFDFEFDNFDDCQVVFSGSGVWRMVDPYFENPGSDANSAYYVPVISATPSAAVLMDLIDPIFTQDASTKAPAEFIETSSTIDITNAQVFRNAASGTVTSFMVANYASFNICNVTPNNTPYTYFLNGFENEMVGSDDGNVGQLVGCVGASNNSWPSGWVNLPNNVLGAVNGGAQQETVSTIGATFPDTITFNGQDSFTTASLGGSQLSPGTCASSTTALGGNVATSSAAFVTTPTANPGSSFYWETVLVASSSVSTRVCAVTTSTPAAATYNVKIIQ